jgi:hypothetical protein
MSNAKVNILALPSHTALLFGLIALVVLGAALSSLLPGAQLWPLPIIIGFTLLPLRDFLQRPDGHLRRAGLAQTMEPAATELQATLHELNPAVSPPVAVVVSAQSAEAHAFGTFRRRYVGMGRNLVANLAKVLRSSDPEDQRLARAVLAHELAHLLNHDVELMWLAYGLLKMMVLVMAVDLVIGLLLSSFIIEVGPEVLRPEFWAALSRYLMDILPGRPVVELSWILDSMRSQNPALVERLADPLRQTANWQPFFIYLAGSHTPFFLSGAILWAYYWRRLLRVREFYADARAATLVGADVIPEAIEFHKFAATMAQTGSARPQALHPVNGARRAASAQLRERWRRVALRGRTAWTAISHALTLWPATKEREACLADPTLAFGSPGAITLSAGLAVVLLEQVLRGTLTAVHITEPGAHLPMLAGFATFSLWALPRLCAGQPVRGALLRSLALAVAIFTGIKLAMYVLDLAAGLLMMFSNPTDWGRGLDLWVYAMTGGLGPDLPRMVGADISWMQILEWHVLRPMAYFGLFMPPVLLAWLAMDAALKRRALTWYALDRRIRPVFWGISAALGLFLALAVIPLLNRVLFAYVYPSWSATELIGIGGALIGGVLAALVFWRADRRLAQRCPGCGERVAEAFTLGRDCPRCGHALHAWLVASY